MTTPNAFKQQWQSIHPVHRVPDPSDFVTSDPEPQPPLKVNMYTKLWAAWSLCCLMLSLFVTVAMFSNPEAHQTAVYCLMLSVFGIVFLVLPIYAVGLVVLALIKIVTK